MTFLSYLLTFMAGGTFGIIIMAALITAKKADEQSERNDDWPVGV